MGESAEGRTDPSDLCVMHIVEASFAGVGRHVLDLANEQASRGVEVHVVFSPVRESPSFASERRCSDNVTYHSISMSRSVGPPDLAAYRALRGLVRRVRPDVIHGHSTKGGIMARLVPRGHAIVLYTPHAVYSMNPNLGRAGRAIVETMERQMSRRTDCVIAVSPEERDHLRTIGVAAETCVVIPNGVHPFEGADRSHVRATLGLPETAIVFGFVGRLDHQKAPGDLLRAFDSIAPELPTAHLAIVGDGPLATELETHVEAASYGDRVHLLGEQPGRWAMSGFDVFVLPSRYEGFPYVLIEAASAGLPIITTDGACSSQLTRPGIESWVVPAGGVIELGTAMLEAASSPGAMLEATTTGRREVASEFTIDAMVDRVDDLMHQLLPIARGAS